MLLKGEQAYYTSDVQSYYQQISWVVEQRATTEDYEELEACEEREQEAVQNHKVICPSKVKGVHRSTRSQWLENEDIL